MKFSGFVLILSKFVCLDILSGFSFFNLFFNWVMVELVGEEEIELGEEFVLILFFIRLFIEIKLIYFLLLMCEL